MPKLSEVTGQAPQKMKLSQVIGPVADFSGVTSSVDTTARVPGQAQPRSAGQELGRSFGLGGRAILEGVGSTLGIASDPLAAAADMVTNKVSPGSRPFGTARDGFSGLADFIGLPSPENAAERVSGDITGALAGGGGLIGLGRGLAARAPGVAQGVGSLLSSLPGAQVTSTAVGSGAAGVTRESGGGQGAQLAAGLLGGLGPSVGVATGQEAIRRAVRGGEAGRRQMEQGINNFRALGAQPSVGQAVGSWRTQGAESLLAGGPTSGGVMARFAERQAEDIGGGLQGLAEGFYRNASGERAGRAIEKGVGTFSDNIRATRRALYWNADQHIPETTRLPMTNTQRALTELTSLTPGAESTTAVMINPKISTLARTMGEDLFAAKATGTGGIPYSAVKDIRSRIGQELSDFSLSTDKPTAEYKRLYAALSQDMEAAAKQQGPEAMRAVKRANNYFKVSSERLAQLERVVDKNGGPEKVYSAVMAGTRDGGTTLRAVMQSLPKDGQQALTGAVIKRMGLANPSAQDAAGEVFSAQTFLTNWNKVSPEAKRALFDRHGPKFTQNMDRIARVASRIKDGSKVFANPSGTANRAAAYTYGAGLAATAAGAAFTGGILPFAVAALTGVGGNVAARAMTNPRFVSWLSNATEMPAGSLVQQVNVLHGIAERTGEEEFAQIADALEAQADQL